MSIAHDFSLRCVCTSFVMHLLFLSLSFPQLTRATGKRLQSLDLSNCTLTDEACASIAKHCQCIEALGLGNMREITGTPLNRLFTDRERREHITGVTLSGSRNVITLLPKDYLFYLFAPHSFNQMWWRRWCLIVPTWRWLRWLG